MKTILSIFLILLSFHLQATIYTVKQDGTGDFSSIQTGFSTINDGDTLIVYPGTYYEILMFTNKSICLASRYMQTADSAYIYNTILDGNQEHRILEINGNFAESNMIIDGFTFQHANVPESSGGALKIWESDGIIIRNSIFHENFAYSGSAIYLTYTEDATFENIVVENNYSYGITVGNSYFSDVYLSNVSVRNNYATGGSGLFVGYESVYIFDPENRCNVYNNYGSYGKDFLQGNAEPVFQEIIVDTFSVMQPDNSFACSVYSDGTPTNLLSFDILHAAIEPINEDLYVDPVNGSNDNSGLNPQEALKTITYAYQIIASDANHPNTIHLASGIYSDSLSGEFYPIPTRSYISLIGDSINRPILDLENYTIFTISFAPNTNFSLQNLNIINLNGMFIPNEYSTRSLKYSANENLKIENVNVQNSVNGNFSTIGIYGCPSMYVDNLHTSNTVANKALKTNSRSDYYSSRGVIMNSSFDYSVPYDFEDPNSYSWGTALGISSDYYYADRCFIDVINTQMTNNIGSRDPGFNSPVCSAFHSGGKTNINMVNVTIADNGLEGSVDDGIGAILLQEGPHLQLYNSILYGDTLTEIYLGWGPPPIPQIDITYSNIQGGEEGIVVNNGILNYLAGNLDTIPYFNDTSAYPYQLRWDSPLIDQGTPIYTEGMEPPYIKIIEDKICLIGIYGDSIWLPSTDLAGRPRIKGGRIDMGAYEYQDTATRINKYYQKDIENFTAKVFPNPFKNNLFVYYEQKEQTEGFNLFIYDVKGYEIRDLSNGYTLANKGRVIWDGKDEWGQEMPSGTYFLYGMIKERKVFSKKVVKK
jgi:hypothetical protein